jgi:hypothetical protein
MIKPAQPCTYSTQITDPQILQEFCKIRLDVAAFLPMFDEDNG